MNGPKPYPREKEQLSQPRTYAVFLSRRWRGSEMDAKSLLAVECKFLNYRTLVWFLLCLCFSFDYFLFWCCGWIFVAIHITSRHIPCALCIFVCELEYDFVRCLSTLNTFCSLIPLFCRHCHCKPTELCVYIFTLFCFPGVFCLLSFYPSDSDVTRSQGYPAQMSGADNIYSRKIV